MNHEISAYHEQASQERKPQGNPLEDHYTRLYRRVRSDSNPHSRTTLRRASRAAIWQLDSSGVVIDIGSGPQQFEHELFTVYRGSQPEATFFTVDFADIPAEKLKAAKYPNVHHMKADGAALPFPNESADVVISNMGIEYLGEQGLQGIHDVLKPEGVVFANWWTSRNAHVEIDPEQLRTMTRRAQEENKSWMEFMRSGIAPHLGKDADAIQEAWESVGLRITGFEEIVPRDHSGESWYQITATRPQEQQTNPLPFEAEEFVYAPH